MFDQVTVFGVISLINFATCLSIGTFLFARSNKNQIHIGYCAFDYCIAFYAFFYFLWQSTSHRALEILFFKACIAGVVLINSAFVHFTLVLLALHRKHLNQLLVVHAVNTFFCYCAFSLFYDAWTPKYTYGLWPIPSAIFHFYLVWWFAQVIFCFALIFCRGVLKTEGREKNQYKWIFWSTLIAYAGGATNWLVWYDVPFPPYLNSGIAVYVLVLAYAIFKYQLLGIDLIVKRTLVFAGLFSCVLAIFIFITFLTQDLLHVFSGKGKTLGLLISVFLIILGYDSLRSLLSNLTDRYLFQKKVNYRWLLKEASEYLAHLDSLKRQARRIVTFLINKVRITSASIYTFQSIAPGSLLLQAGIPKIRTEGHKTILLSHPLIEYLSAHRSPLQLQTLQELNASEKGPQKSAEFTHMIELFKFHHAEALIPCFGSTLDEGARRTEVHLRGMLFLGPKKSDEPYTPEDLDIFYTLGQESSIAFENARLYDEQVKRSKELQDINQELLKAKNELSEAFTKEGHLRLEAERLKDEALLAKKKTEEMELELIRREKLIFIELLMKGLAHEIFNPMQPMTYHFRALEEAYTELFFLCKPFTTTMDQDLEQRYFGSFDTIRRSVDALSLGMDHIKNVVHTMTQMQSKNDEAVKPFDLKTFWELVRPLMEMETHGETLTDIPTDYEIERNLPLVVGNATQLTQVFINFFRNAQYAMKDTREKLIMVTAKRDPANPAFIKLSFSDNGSGIPKEILPKIFDFGYTTKGEKGQGIGLNQCQLIVEKFFRGTLACESEAGKGTTFIIKLPIWKGELPDEKDPDRG